MKKAANILVKSFFYLIMILILFVSVSFFLLQMPEVQTGLSHKTTEWLGEKLGGNISVGKIRANWFDNFVIEDLNIKDREDRNMIYVREIYLDTKTNFKYSLSEVFHYSKEDGFSFRPEKFIQFDNNLDYVTLRDPVVHFIKDSNNMLNFDYWLLEIDKLTKKDGNEDKDVIPFTLDNATVQNGLIRITSENTQRTTDGTFDFSNFEFAQLNARLKDLYFKRDTMSMTVRSINARDQYSPLEIKELNGRFFRSKKEMKLDRFHAAINNSTLGDRLYFYYDKPSDFGDFFKKVILDGDLTYANFKSKDLGLFIPTMKEYREEYKVISKFKGTVDDLYLKDANIKFGEGSEINGDGHLTGLPNLPQVHSDLDIRPSVILAKDLFQYSDNPGFRKYGEKIERLEFSGLFEGYYNQFTAQPKLFSSQLGDLEGEISLNANQNLDYSGNLQTKSFKLGFLLDEENLNAIAFEGKISGSGRILPEAVIHVDGLINRLDFRGYPYQNLTVDGDLGRALFLGKLKIDDPNISANLEGEVDFNQAENLFNFKGEVADTHLKTLGFTNKDYLLNTKVDFNFEGNSIDDWVGEAGFHDFLMKEGNKDLRVNSMQFLSERTEKSRKLNLKSGLFDIDLEGNFIPSTLFEDVKTLVNEVKMYFETTENERTNYYSEKISRYVEVPEKYETKFRVDFNDPAPFFDFFTEGVFVSPNSWISGNYNSDLVNSFQIQGETDTLSVFGNEFYGTNFEYSAEKESLSPFIDTKFRVKSDKQKTGNNVFTEELVINANWEGSKTIDFRAFVTQEATESLFDLRGQLDFYNEGFKIKLLPEYTQTVLLGQSWKFPDNNFIDYRFHDISFQNFGFSGADGQKVSLEGKLSENRMESLVLDLDRFNLENLEPFINVELKGIATGNLILQDIYHNPTYNSNLHVEDLYYQKSLIGTLISSAEFEEDKKRIKIKGNIFRKMEEIIRFDGFYHPERKTNPLALKGVMANVDMDMFLGMTGDVFSYLEGNANGKFEVSGTLRRPVFTGKIDITDGSLEVAVSGTRIYFQDSVILTENGFELDPEGITIFDAPNGHAALLKGGVYYRPGPGFTVDLTAKTLDKEGFKLMEIKNFANDYIFGTALATGDINLSGSFGDLLISGNLASKEGTHIVIPADAGTIIDTKEEGIPFIIRDTYQGANRTNSNGKTKKLETGGIRISFNLSFTPEADGEIIFDRANNDILSFYGEGNLSILFDSRGEFTITGPYVMMGGKYFFSFQNLASLRKFEIAENSKINFNGDPFDAIVDIKASYTANLSLNKISPQLANSSGRFPVLVNVALTDRLLAPTINYGIAFDLKQVPISGQTDLLAFEQRLANDEQLLSRNVSSVLVLNELFPDNNMAEAISQQFLIDNIGSLISNQIGTLANRLNPNLEFGIQFGDFRESLLNNMQLDFSYKFLNNRIKLSGKGSFINSLEDNINVNPNNYGQLSVGGELEYLISDDGEYKFKLYSRSIPTNYYVFYSHGNVVVSGGSFILTKNFNSLINRGRSTPVGIRTEEDYIERKKED